MSYDVQSSIIPQRVKKKWGVESGSFPARDITQIKGFEPIL